MDVHDTQQQQPQQQHLLPIVHELEMEWKQKAEARRQRHRDSERDTHISIPIRETQIVKDLDTDTDIYTWHRHSPPSRRGKESRRERENWCRESASWHAHRVWVESSRVEPNAYSYIEIDRYSAISIFTHVYQYIERETERQKDRDIRIRSYTFKYQRETDAWILHGHHLFGRNYDRTNKTGGVWGMPVEWVIPHPVPYRTISYMLHATLSTEREREREREKEREKGVSRRKKRKYRKDATTTLFVTSNSLRFPRRQADRHGTVHAIILVKNKHGLTPYCILSHRILLISSRTLLLFHRKDKRRRRIIWHLVCGSTMCTKNIKSNQVLSSTL